MITILINKELDKEVFKDFWGFSAGGADFGARIKQIHPDITEENADTYIDRYYEEHAAELISAQKELQETINHTSPEYFAAISEVFGKDYSDQTYTGMFSIFDCNPRYVDKKEFQVFYKRDVLGKLEVAYHEVLHFVFFEHAAHTCPSVVGTLDTNGGSYWALSELFNVLILNKPTFQKILQREEKMFYSMLAPYLEPIRTMFEIRKDFCGFLSNSLTYLEEKRGEAKS